MKGIQWLWQPFYVLYVVVSFLISIVLAFPIFLCSGLINTSKSRRFIYYVVHYWARLWLMFIGMPLRCYGRFPNDKKYIVVANHISYLDTINIYGAIPAYFRTLARKEMVHIPIFGMVYKQLTILVDRSSTQSRTKSMKLMWRLLKNESHIAIFPEGSFNETPAVLKDFYDGAFRLAVNTQTPILPILFPDTQSRWHYSHWWKLKPGKNRAYFLPPIDVDGLEVQALKEKTFGIMEQQLHELYQGKIPSL